MKSLNFKHTVMACCVGYTVQAIVCNFAPLLFVTWGNQFNITTLQTTTVITLTFFIQIVVDLSSVLYVDKIGYRASLIIAHILAGIGFFLLTILPYKMENAFSGIVISISIYSIGAGLLEVLVSPVVENCPSSNKASSMSFLHSFFSWGAVATIAISTLTFKMFGRENWQYITYVWATLSFINAIVFLFVPINDMTEESTQKNIFSLFKNKFFIVAIVLMICAGASELSVSQWASTFAEEGLGVSKTVGDLAGPMAFAALMGTGRIIFSKFSLKFNIEKYLVATCVLCVVSYLMIGLSQNAVISLIGCALCGLAVAALWPGAISLSSKAIPTGGTALFAFLAFAGDIGCTGGPTITGYITDAFDGNLKIGLLFSVVFPILMIIALMGYKIKKKK